MSGYQPKVGDRVRVVIEGEIGVNSAATATPWFIVGDESTGSLICPGAEQVVSVEKVTPPLPTTPGSVLRYDTGLAGCEQTFLLHDDGIWRDACAADPCELSTGVNPERCTIIFDAGAES